MLNEKYRKKILMYRIIWTIVFLLSFLQAGFSINSNSEAKNLAGMRMLADKRPAEAEIFFRQAIAGNNQVHYYYNNLAVSLMHQKKYNEAIIQLNKAIIIDPDYVKALSNLAVCYFHLTDYRKAYHYYKKAEKLNNDYVRSRFTREKIKEKTKDMEKKDYDEKKIDEIIDSVLIN
ncbi:MAG TPA: tetratricopeptide repeat protein [Spirochaetota bacterium]|nr:tetratricopeptide repeat protein [Spirochaetota bacterium]HPR38372.1 tetratricopeptide repeat protein [Spirochaetota bacterium]HRX48242.1 tetratricopeptide repeat protein [Spirochaetota bacterium]